MKTHSLRRGFLSKFIGDRAFYAMVLSLVLPMMLQDAITSFVGLLDNIMVGQTGTEQMSGVAIANQLLLVYNMSIFGGNGGAGIFAAQFCGKGDPDGIRHTLRYKLLLALVLSAGALALLFFFDARLIGMFLHDSADGGDLALTLASGKAYLRVMLLGLLPFAVAQAYASTLREVGETSLPMKAGVTAVFVNLVFNFLLIYPTRSLTLLGLTFTMPGAGLGVVGAAWATVLSRVVELVVVVAWAHTHTARFPFFKKLWRSLRLPGQLALDITVKGMPLMINELLYTVSLTVINQCYSLRGLTVVAAFNISGTVSGLFTVISASLGSALGIVVGQILGEGNMKKAVDTDRKMIAFAVAVGAAVGCVLVAVAGLFPQLYNTSGQVRQTAAGLIRIIGVFTPMHAFLQCCYFTLRCGGKTGVTFVFDCAFICLGSLPAAWLLAHFTGMNILWMYVCVQLVDLGKCLFGFIMVKRGVWINNIVAMDSAAAPAAE